MAGENIVILDAVTKRYGAVTAVDQLSMSIARGEMFGLIGPDGAGKTTTIRLMCGLLRADAGRVEVLGADPVRAHRTLTDSVGYLSQHFSLYGDLSIDENVAFFAEIHGVRDYATRRDRLLEMTQLTPFRGRLADRLSGGMKQKLALVCTLVHEPKLIVLDEPTTGVDPILEAALGIPVSGTHRHLEHAVPGRSGTLLAGGAPARRASAGARSPCGPACRGGRRLLRSHRR